MKSVIVTNKSNGLNSRFLVPEDSELSNAESGIPVNFIDLTLINWAEIRKTIHNKLVEHDLMSLTDIKTAQGNRILHQIVCKIVIDRIVQQYIKEFKSN